MAKKETALTPSAWITRFAHLISPEGQVLDLACGSGRHTRYLVEHGYKVTCIDRDISKLGDLQQHESIEIVQADLEDGPWPLADRKFNGIIIANYLHRPIMPRIANALSDQGVLIYETFAQGNEKFGRPSNPDFLLKPGELLEVVRGHFRVIAFEEVAETEPRPACRQRICAIRV